MALGQRTDDTASDMASSASIVNGRFDDRPAPKDEEAVGGAGAHDRIAAGCSLLGKLEVCVAVDIGGQDDIKLPCGPQHDV
jgi:hypothetical protein